MQSAAKAAFHVRFNVGVTDGGLTQEGQLSLEAFNLRAAQR